MTRKGAGQAGGHLEACPGERERLARVLAREGFALEAPLARGFSSRVYRVRARGGRRLALKLEREDCPRPGSVAREARHLRAANEAGVGPRLEGVDRQARALWMAYVEGVPLRAWVLAGPSRHALARCINRLFLQAAALDRIGLDHGQLAGAGTNILVREDGEPVILDFEKASTLRRAHNVRVLNAYFFCNPRGLVARRVRELLGYAGP